MSRYLRNTVILAKPESSYGVDSVPTAASNALLVADTSITTLDAKNVDRNVIRGYFGGSEELVGLATKKLSFSVELAGSGAAGTAPAWGNLLLGCAMAEAILASPARVEYTPVSTSLQSLTIYYYDDGALHKLLGAMGTCTLTAKVGERPMLKFDFIGLDGGDSASANPSPTLTAWQKPVVMTQNNVTDIKIGLSYAAGAFSGGTAYPSNGLEIMFNNEVNHNPLLSSETVDIANRDMSGSVAFDLTAGQEVSFQSSVKANTTQTMGMVIGTSAGNKVMIYMPTVQMINPKKEELNGKRLIGYDLRVIPSTGNDELKLVTL